MFARLSAFVIWSLVAATAAFWALRFAASPPPVPAYAVAVGKSVVVRGDLTRLFGVPPRVAVVAGAAPEAPSRFKLVGVMAPRSLAAQAEAGRGLALIAVDGKPAKAFAVGARLDSDLVLQAVGLRTASIGPARGARSVLLELPALPQPNAGVLPPVGAGGAPVPPATAMRGPATGVPSAMPSAGSAIAPVGGQPPIAQPPPGGLVAPALTPNPPLPASDNLNAQ
jgi:general secretion pathway protein C